VQLDLYKTTIFGDVRIPCILEIGSCTYRDTCTLLTQGTGIDQIDSVLAVIRKGLPLQVCPFTPFTLNIDSYTIEIPAIGADLRQTVKGDYRIVAKFLDHDNTATVLGCLDVRLRVNVPRS